MFSEGNVYEQPRGLAHLELSFALQSEQPGNATAHREYNQLNQNDAINVLTLVLPEKLKMVVAGLCNSLTMDCKF